jgi:hypothetical protein
MADIRSLRLCGSNAMCRTRFSTQTHVIGDSTNFCNSFSLKIPLDEYIIPMLIVDNTNYILAIVRSNFAPDQNLTHAPAWLPRITYMPPITDHIVHRLQTEKRVANTVHFRISLSET